MITRDPIRQQEVESLPWTLLAVLFICLGAATTAQTSIEQTTDTESINTTHPDNHTFTKIKSSNTLTEQGPDLGTFYDCGVTKFDGAYALPDPLNCINQNKIG